MKIQQGPLVSETRPGDLLHEQPSRLQKPPMPSVESEPFYYAAPEYIYQTADPFRAEIDQTNASCSINARHPRWLRRAWLFLMVGVPAISCVLLIGILGMFETFDAFGAVVIVLSLAVEVAVFALIWRRSGASVR